MSQPILEFEQVSKWYGSVLGVNHVTLELSPGITGLVGANGAGKSTLLKLATGQLRPTLGRVTIDGVDAWSWHAKRQVGYCPDVDRFFEDLSGRAFVYAMARLDGLDRSTATRRTEEVLTQVGMSDRSDRKIAGYSKGMRQRIKLAQALLLDPKLLVLDEPLSGIDPMGRQEMLELFRQLEKQGKAIFISSHELEELEKLTETVAILARGRIAAVGTLQQIRNLLEDQPLTIRIDVDRSRDLAKWLVLQPEVVGLDLKPKSARHDADGEPIVVQATNPRRFFELLGQHVISENFEIRRLEALDDSAHAILGYLLGGSGKT
jgi:ABC-2 type transport system ATP-binding protein